MQTIINKRKVFAMPNEERITGNSKDTKKAATHKNRVDTDMPIALYLLGNISEISTQVTGPNEPAKEAI